MADTNRRYHVTPARNLASIAERGLLPMIGPRSTEAAELKPQIYLFASIEALEQALLNWLSEALAEEQTLAVLATTAGAAVPEGFECVVTEPIGADQLWLISEDLDSEISIEALEHRAGLPLIEYAARSRTKRDPTFNPRPL